MDNTKESLEFIQTLIQTYHDSGLMAKDIAALEPKERVSIIEKFMQYVYPRRQASSVDLSTKDQDSELIMMVKKACGH